MTNDSSEGSTIQLEGPCEVTYRKYHATGNKKRPSTTHHRNDDHKSTTFTYPNNTPRRPSSFSVGGGAILWIIGILIINISSLGQLYNEYSFVNIQPI